jgi:hypothetical protein
LPGGGKVKKKDRDRLIVALRVRFPAPFVVLDHPVDNGDLDPWTPFVSVEFCGFVLRIYDEGGGTSLWAIDLTAGGEESGAVVDIRATAHDEVAALAFDRAVQLNEEWR